MITDKPLLDPEISNVGTPEGGWGAFMLLETGGDAMRWARRAFHEKSLGYDEIVGKAAQAPAGADRLFFLPYLTGERFGDHRNARAQFFGITAEHGLAHLHRAVLEGVAFAVARHIRIMEQNSGCRLERVIASGGGAKSELWLKIKASVYGISIVVPTEPECGVVGSAILAATAEGRFSDLRQGGRRLRSLFARRCGRTLLGGKPTPACSRFSKSFTAILKRFTANSTGWLECASCCSRNEDLRCISINSNSPAGSQSSRAPAAASDWQRPRRWPRQVQQSCSPT